MKHTFRNWHVWISLVCGLPLILVGLTAIFIAHDQALGTKDVVVPFTGGVGKAEPVDLRKIMVSDGATWAATKAGLWRLEQSEWKLASTSWTDDLRDVVAMPGALLAAGKKGIWRIEGERASVVFKGDCWGITRTDKGWLGSCKQAVVVANADALQWAKSDWKLPAGTVTAQRGMTLSKVIMDIHTGKLFFGKTFEWVWIDLLGLACIGLGISGFVMWMRGRKVRAAAVE